MTSLEWLKLINELVCGFHSNQSGKASNSELKSWINQKAVIINGRTTTLNEVHETIESFVLFPGGKRKITIW